MCTVTFVPVGNKVFLTSSRDEIQFRAPAIPPAFFQYSTGKLIFPKDREAGGTWICLHQNGNVVVLLNGAFVKHIPQPPYRKSRGLILLEIADSFSPIYTFSQIDLSGIEPFTVIIRDNSSLFECQWDGNTKCERQIDSSLPHTWSSVTLYSAEVISQRTNWFKQWLRENENLSLDLILQFHQYDLDGKRGGSSNAENADLISTVSITGLELTPQSGCMQYIDLLNQQCHFEQMNLCKANPVRQ